jgi:hypothetical protein
MTAGPIKIRLNGLSFKDFTGPAPGGSAPAERGLRRIVSALYQDEEDRLTPASARGGRGNRLHAPTV